VALFLVLGLLSKEMLVTLPAVMLLLDYWPLQRLQFTGDPGRLALQRENGASVWSLFREKIPFLALSVVFSVVTFIALRSFRQSVVTYSWPERIGNAIVSYVTYLAQMVFPVGLTPWYPHPGQQLGLPEVLFSLLVLLAISALALATGRTRPYLIIGWLWYLGMLFPVIGLVQRGEQSHADRYTYLSQIGLYIMIAWGIGDLSSRWRQRRLLLGSAAAAVLIGLMVLAHRQTSHWRNSEALWKHTLAHTSRNYVAHLNLAVNLAQSGRIPEALPHFEQALQIRPTSAEAQNNYGYTLALLGRLNDAVPFYENAIRLKADFVGAYLNLADALTALGRTREAQAHYATAARLTGGSAPAPKAIVSP